MSFRADGIFFVFFYCIIMPTYKAFVIFLKTAYVLIKITKTEKERSFSAAKANVAAPVFYRVSSCLRAGRKHLSVPSI